MSETVKNATAALAFGAAAMFAAAPTLAQGHMEGGGHGGGGFHGAPGGGGGGFHAPSATAGFHGPPGGAGGGFRAPTAIAGFHGAPGGLHAAMKLDPRSGPRLAMGGDRDHDGDRDEDRDEFRFCCQFDGFFGPWFWGGFGFATDAAWDYSNYYGYDPSPPAAYDTGPAPENYPCTAWHWDAKALHYILVRSECS